MFGWKRQRKEDPEVECAPLGSSPAAVVDMEPLNSGSSCSSLCSETEDALQLASPSSSGISGIAPQVAANGLQLSSIELAAHPREPLPCGAVRSKVAAFEALCQANTTVHIQCSAEDVQQICSYPVPECSHGNALANQQQPQQDAVMRRADSGEDAADSWQEFSEVHMVIRLPLPRNSSSSSGGKYGSAAEMEALIEQLQGALLLKERERKAAADACARRSGECENLQRVVREMSESRAKAVSQRALLAEKYAELQQEFHRMLRIADLSRTVSKENMANTSRTRTELRRVQLELHATKNHAQSLNEKNKKVRVENILLKEKVSLLERLEFEDVQESEVKKHFTRYRLAETY